MIREMLHNNSTKLSETILTSILMRYYHSETKK